MKQNKRTQMKSSSNRKRTIKSHELHIAIDPSMRETGIAFVTCNLYGAPNWTQVRTLTIPGIEYAMWLVDDLPGPEGLKRVFIYCEYPSYRMPGGSVVCAAANVFVRIIQKHYARTGKRLIHMNPSKWQSKIREMMQWQRTGADEAKKAVIRAFVQRVNATVANDHEADAVGILYVGTDLTRQSTPFELIAPPVVDAAPDPAPRQEALGSPASATSPPAPER